MVVCVRFHRRWAVEACNWTEWSSACVIAKYLCKVRLSYCQCKSARLCFVILYKLATSDNKVSRGFSLVYVLWLG